MVKARDPINELKLFALLAAGALALHEASYGAWALLGGERGELPGHAYFAWLMPLIAVLLAVVACSFLLAVARPSDQRRAAPRRLPELWALAAAALLAVFLVQELAEALATGNTGAIEGIVGIRGLIAVALAVVIAGPAALVLRAADAVLRWAASRRRRPLAAAAMRPPRRALRGAFSPTPGLGRNLAPRGPPLAS